MSLQSRFLQWNTNNRIHHWQRRHTILQGIWYFLLNLLRSLSFSHLSFLSFHSTFASVIYSFTRAGLQTHPKLWCFLHYDRKQKDPEAGAFCFSMEQLLLLYQSNGIWHRGVYRTLYIHLKAWNIFVFPELFILWYPIIPGICDNYPSCPVLSSSFLTS